MLDEVSEGIRRRRKFLRLSQQELARRSGVSRATLSAFENNRYTDLGIRKVDRICSALQLRITLQPGTRPTLVELMNENEL
jgi:transcriptional regulator with XRE-family HTH domain